MDLVASYRLIKPITLAASLAVGGLLAGCGGSLSSGTFAALGEGKSEAPTAALGGATPITTASIEGDGKGKSSKSIKRVAEQVAASSTPGNAGYRIGPQDMLDFSVFKVPELQRSVVVAETGTINLPLIGEVQAGGRTASELERDVAQRLGKKFLQNPQVSFIVREYNSQRITLEGAVKKPGVYPLRGKTTLLQVIATAEGFTETGEATVVIFRQEGGKKLAAKFDIAEIRSGGSTDPVLQAGDTIVAPTSVTKEAFATIMKALPLATFAALAL